MLIGVGKTAAISQQTFRDLARGGLQLVTPSGELPLAVRFAMARSSSGHAPQPAGSASRGAPQSACKEITKKRRRERSSSSCSKADWGESNDERSSSVDCSADLGPKKVRSKEARLKIETVTHSKPGTEEDEQKGGSGNGIAVEHTNVAEAGGVLRVLRGFDGLVLLALSPLPSRRAFCAPPVPMSLEHRACRHRL